MIFDFNLKSLSMKANTKFVLNTLHVVSWIIFIGLCIQTGAIIFSYCISMWNPTAAHHLYKELDFSNLYDFDIIYYSAIMLLIAFLSGLKAYIFYFIINIFLKINIVHPFSKEIASLIDKISYTALLCGVIGIMADSYTEWLTKNGVELSVMQKYLGGTSEFLFLAAVVFLIAQIFKKGIELQSENELTI